LVYVDGRIYGFGQDGRTVIFKPGKAFESLGENQLEGGFMASAAIVGKAFFLRTKTHLYRIENGE
ncbi:MAG: quinonprotein alcohol dehydrogenase, partial [Planctomycetota bacterium]|nr:quinonprotein alcohol dehydrogenase [Planctomycetota bacterium]